jgi:hypothetical protein
MTAILENIYRRIADEKHDFTETEFSQQYLGKSGTYFAYLKCTGKDVSSDALLKLWGRLNIEHQTCANALTRTQHAFSKHMLQEWVELYSGLSNDVFTVLHERAHA